MLPVIFAYEKLYMLNCESSAFPLIEASIFPLATIPNVSGNMFANVSKDA